jgi:hypothetical protein
MTTLTKVAVTARKIIRYSIYAVIFLIVGKILLDSGIKIYKKAFPAPTPAPTIKYGKLTKIPFPENGISAKLTYTLETTSGSLPTDLPTQAKVFFMPKKSANLLSLDTAKAVSSALGFGSNAQQVSDTVYKFTSANFPSTLQINIITGTFSISYNLAADQSPLDSKPPISEVAASEFRSYLSGADVLPEDLTGLVTHDFLKLSNGNLISALSLSEANLTKINLFRKSYDNLPSMTAGPDQANVWAIVSGSNSRGQQIIAAEYHYHNVDETQYSTYPIISSSEAFTALQNGQAFIASLGVNKDGDVLKIRKIYLAYFDPSEITEYYQPIYVFEGDNGFIAYLPAVASTYYGE